MLLCAPLGHEAITTYHSQVQLARTLASDGFPVLRFDYLGTGDSEGEEHEAGQLAAWRESLDGAARELQRLSSSPGIVLFGIRLGGLLALDGGPRVPNVESIVAWAPPVRGSAYVRELLMSGQEMDDGSVHAMGHRYSAETLRDLAALDPYGLHRQPAPRVLIIDRDDLPALTKPLCEALRSRGAEVHRMTLPGFAALVRGGTQGALHDDDLAALAAWCRDAGCSSPDRCFGATALPTTAALEGSGWRETLLQLGSAGLYGVLGEPHGARSQPRGSQATVLLLNVGDNYRVGPHRLYVRVARELVQAGHRVVRLDLPGLGDSPVLPGRSQAELYDPACVPAVSSVLDTLAGRGCRDFVLVGLCSGAYVAFQTALVDGRVRGIALLNTRLLEWTAQARGADWREAPELHVRSARAYGRAMLQPHNWSRFLRREFTARWARQRVSSMWNAALREVRWLVARGRPTLTATMRRLCREGTDVLVLSGDTDEGLGYLEHHFGRAGRRMRRSGRFTMETMPAADHTFSRAGNLEYAIARLSAFIAAGAHRRRESDGVRARAAGTSQADNPSTLAAAVRKLR